MATPIRTQYIFDLSGVKYKTRADILRIQRQWETFERGENYNDIVYQKLATGNRETLYYQFRTRDELLDYRNGQELHVLRYPVLGAAGEFNSISNRAMPNVPVTTKAPEYSMAPTRGLNFSTSMSASELTSLNNDMTIYMHVSSYNSEHYFKYNFPSDEEKLAYHRAELRIMMSNL
jgi:hypothetical protein